MAWIREEVIEILQTVRSLWSHRNELARLLDEIRTDQRHCCKSTLEKLDHLSQVNQAVAQAVDANSGKLDRILVLLAPPPIDHFAISITILDSKGEITMVQRPSGSPKAAVMKAAVNLKVLDSGHVVYTATTVDAAGFPSDPQGLPDGSSAPVWASSDPALDVSNDPAVLGALDPPITDASGLTAVGTPKALGTGIVATVSATLPSPDGGTTPGKTITGNADPVDIGAGPAGGFAVKEQAV